MQLNNTKTMYATDEARKEFEGKTEKKPKKSGCPSCEIKNEDKNENIKERNNG